jgi:hypothetical protein
VTIFCPSSGPLRWAEREAQLRAALQEAADGLLALGKINAAAHEKYFLSLTDQEIIHGLPGYRTVIERASPSSPSNGPPAIAFISEIVTESSAASGPIRQVGGDADLVLGERCMRLTTITGPD